MSTDSIADEIKFAYWVPNVSGGLVTSDIEQRTNWEFEYNKKLAQTAECLDHRIDEKVERAVEREVEREVDEELEERGLPDPADKR